MRISFPFFGLLLLLLLGGLGARGQNPCPAPPPANCPQPFKVVDAGTGQEVTVLQVGCPVRFEQNCGRATPPTLLYYQVLPGTNSIPAGCNPTTTAGVVTYTPTAADVGPVTVFELSNSLTTPGLGIAYVRNYTVINPAPPTFAVAPCAGNTAFITLTNPVYSSYTVQVNGGAPQPLTTSLQVAITPGGANTFVVTGNPGSSCPQSATQTLTLPVAQTPGFTRLTRTGAAASGGPATLDFSQLSPGFAYTLELETPGQPGTYTTVAGTTVAPATGASTATASLAVASGRYRLRRTDACGNSEASNAIITLGLSGTAVNGRNTLTFAPFDASVITGYTLTRSPGSLTVPLPGSATSYDDASVQCGTAYTYRLTATLVGGGESISNIFSLTAQSTTLPPAPLAVPSFDLQNRVVVTVTPGTGAAFGPGGQVLISRQGSSGNFNFAPLRTGTAGLPRRTLRDSLLTSLPTAAPCYSAVVRDTCGNASPTSPTACPVLLRAVAADPEGLTAQLTWSAFQGPGSPAAPVAYRVLTIAADGTVLATSAPTTALSYLDLAPPTTVQILRYRVEASGGGLPAGTVSYSNVSTVTRRPRLVLPTAFTPNGDGLNDVLELKGRYLQNFTFLVVDRNGLEVFRATDPTQTWDGTIQGHAPVNGAYVWRFDLIGEDNQPVRQTGTITILK